MKYFKEMVKLARETGVGGTINPKLDPDATELFWQLVPQNEVFVFSGSVDHRPSTLPDYDFEKIDAPFPIFSIEMVDGPIIHTHGEDDTGAGAARDKFMGTEILCLMVCELSTAVSVLADNQHVELKRGQPYDHALLVYGLCRAHYKDPKYEPTTTHVMQFPVNPYRNERFYALVRTFLDRLGQERDGVEDVKDVVMLPAGKDGKKRKPHPLRRIFHVVPKSRHKSYQPGQGRHVDWTHRWWVRGHWVHFTDSQRIGKNRTGEYVERGRTWRSEHEKGPEGAELVKKTRVVDGVKA